MKIFIFLIYACLIYPQQDSTINDALRRYSDLMDEGLNAVANRIDSLQSLTDSLENIINNGIRVLWYGYEIDSSYLGVNLLNGDLPRRNNGTYLYWKADSLGNLIPKRVLKFYPNNGTSSMENWQKDFWEQ